MTPLALFTRLPKPGQTKTRLLPSLSPEEAAALHVAFLQDVLMGCEMVQRVRASLWIAGNVDDPSLSGLADGIERFEQPEGDLGARMGAALVHMLDRHGCGLILGSDAPTLPVRYLDNAIDALDDKDVVLGPTADGGYYLLGSRVDLTEQLKGIRWSTRHAFGDTVERLNAANIPFATLSPWYDVDRPKDLSLLKAHLEIAPLTAPHTSRAFLGLTPSSGTTL